jgi:hypothetical protein
MQYMPKILIFMLLLLPLQAWRHPIHLSITSIAHNELAHTLEITQRFFVDDFEKRVEQDCGEKLRLGTAQEHAKANQLIEAFIRKQFSLSVNGKTPKLTFIGKEVDVESIIVYIEAADVKKLKQVDVANNVLLDVFDDQRNFVNIKYQGLKKAAILDRKSPNTTISF